MILTLPLSRYPSSPGQGDKPSTCPARQQITKGDYGEVWEQVQRGENHLQDYKTMRVLQDLIEMVIMLQDQVEDQGRKVGDMEEYMDMLLVKIMENTPVLLEKNIMSCKPSK